MAFIDSTALDVVSSTLQSDLHIGATDLFWVLNAYTLFLAALILLGGALGDHYGRKRVFMTGILIFTGASVACGVAANPPVLIAARALQGIGGALMVPGSLALLSVSVASERRGRAIGAWSTFSTLTTLLGPVLGGWLAQQGLWRWVFFINVPLALIALVALIFRVPESWEETGKRPLDWPGAALVTLGLAGITYGFTEAPTYGFTDGRILMALGGGFAALIAFIVVEARSPHPMLPPRLFRSRTFSGANALTLFLYAALGAVPFFLLLNLQKIQVYRQQDAGLVLLPLGILLTLLSRWAGGLVDRVGARLPLMVGPAIAGVGFFLLALPGITKGITEYWVSYFPGILVLGIGMGITVAPLTTTVMGAAPTESSGIASGINNAVARTARALAIAILGAVALVSFSGSLELRATVLNLPAEVRTQLRAEAPKLADAAPPVGLPDDTIAQVKQAIQWSYVDTFRLIAVIAAGLAWLSAIIAAVFVEPRKP
jgi:EmrB/QacA subfamily drug resistance transporter